MLYVTVSCNSCMLYFLWVLENSRCSNQFIERNKPETRIACLVMKQNQIDEGIKRMKMMMNRCDSTNDMLWYWVAFMISMRQKQTYLCQCFDSGKYQTDEESQETEKCYHPLYVLKKSTPYDSTVYTYWMSRCQL